MLLKMKTMSRRAVRFYDHKCAALSALFISLPFVSTMTAFAQSVGIEGIGGQSHQVGEHTWPWVGMLQSLSNQLTGPLPMTLGILGIAAAAIGMFMGNHGAGMQKMLVLIFAVSICLFAPTFVTMISESAGGATIFGM